MGHNTDIPLIQTLSILWAPGKIKYGRSIANLWRNLSTVTPLKFFSTILCFVALVYNCFFFRTAILWKLFGIRFSYKHCNFSYLFMPTRQDGVENRDKVYLAMFLIF